MMIGLVFALLSGANAFANVPHGCSAHDMLNPDGSMNCGRTGQCFRGFHSRGDIEGAIRLQIEGMHLMDFSFRNVMAMVCHAEQLPLISLDVPIPPTPPHTPAPATHHPMTLCGQAMTDPEAMCLSVGVGLLSGWPESRSWLHKWS